MRLNKCNIPNPITDTLRYLKTLSYKNDITPIFIAPQMGERHSVTINEHNSETRITNFNLLIRSAHKNTNANKNTTDTCDSADNNIYTTPIKLLLLEKKEKAYINKTNANNCLSCSIINVAPSENTKRDKNKR